MAKPDWSRKLKQPVDLDGHVLRTLADVREHLRQLPEDRHEWPAVRYIVHLILEAADGKDVGDITVPLRMSRQALRLPETQKTPHQPERPTGRDGEQSAAQGRRPAVVWREGLPPIRSTRTMS
jgi:hypothetical protein